MNSINELYDILKHDLIDEKGKIILNLAEISINIHSKDIIGNSLQEWLGAWFDKYNVKYRVLANTQEFPDYILIFNGIESYLEIKTWNYDRAPAFDLANFNSYIDTLEDNPAKIDADYLILGYSTNDVGFEIKNIFLKKIWELSGKSSVDPLKIQNKKGTIYNIRPMSFHTKPSSTFKNRLEFLEALSETKEKYANQGTKIENIETWKQYIIDKYKTQTGNSL